MVSRRSNGRKAREASAAAERSVYDQEVMVPRQRLRKAAERYQKGV
jgi:hypothetical protein